ncbi:MAG TPA: FAD-binding oxidoreductase, partial [Rhizobiaceae bacterium]|nr:FAD-binding oxidoreductase [Rhizobiaceae bacterium]
MSADVYQSFGRLSRNARRAAPAADMLAHLAGASPDSLLPFGNGRSYGDSCHNDAGTLVDFRGMNRIVAFDPSTGLFTAEAGVLLCDIIAHAAAHGWFLPVTPGTRFVTLGGAIANDVHGKNHHVRGTFGRHVESLTLHRSDRGALACSPHENADLFSATIGGMGLTGFITHATIRMMKVGSLDVEETVSRFDRLDEYFELADAADRCNEYSVAWIDQLAAGTAAGRGVLLAANHADDGEAASANGAAKLSVPFELPVSALNGASLRAFNAVFLAAKSRKAGTRRSGWQGYFYPLDAVGHWNRLYGPRGLFQHQSVIPVDAAPTVIPDMLAATRKAGQSSFLTVLKRFGDVASPGLLSFP